jgi:hypothetical protein
LVGERTEQQEAAEQVQPVRARAHARKRGVARADHERHDVEREALHHRDGEEEHHRRPVHREQLVVEVGADEVAVRGRELVAHQAAHDSGQAREDERGDDEAKPGRLVAVRREESAQAGLVLPGALELGGGARAGAVAVAQQLATIARLRLGA